MVVPVLGWRINYIYPAAYRDPNGSRQLPGSYKYNRVSNLPQRHAAPAFQVGPDTPSPASQTSPWVLPPLGTSKLFTQILYIPFARRSALNFVGIIMSSVVEHYPPTYLHDWCLTRMHSCEVLEKMRIYFVYACVQRRLPRANCTIAA